MEYVLFGNIYFNESERTLNQHGKIEQLSLTQTRLLSALIKRKNKQITRNELLSNIWEKHGLVASNSNLNRNISLLRKSFQNYEIENAIETIPKQGFIFHGEVEMPGEKDEPIPKISHISKSKKFSSIILIAMIFTTLYLGGYYTVTKLNAEKEIKTIQIGKCIIKLSDKTKPKSIDYFLKTKLGREISYLCEKDNKIIFFDDNNIPTSNVNYESHTAICGGENKDECENYLSNNIH